MAAEFVEHHNMVRAQKGVPPLTWNDTLAEAARTWGLTLTGNCDLIHSTGPYGENLFNGTGLDWRPQDAVYYWSIEENYYDLAANTCVPDQMCGHYTQVVWKTTERVGCEVLTCNGGNDTVSLCFYNPPGNWEGERPY
ncbi:hypothetical protein ACLOJK_009932 [Asimina triloba]